MPRESGDPRGRSRTQIQPFDVKLSYNGKPWATVSLKVGHNEIGDADEPEYGMSSNVATLLEAVDLPVPAPVPALPMPLHHQIAQKLHGLSGAGSERAHGLVESTVNCGKTRETRERLFAYRKMQEWSKVINEGENWDELYAAQTNGLDVLGVAGGAVAWVNDLIGRIAPAGR